METDLEDMVASLLKSDEYSRMKTFYGDLPNSDYELINLLSIGDEKAWYTAITIILLYRSQGLISVSVKIYLHCLRQLKNNINSSIIESEFQYWKDKLNNCLFNENTAVNEKFKIANYLQKLLIFFSNIIGQKEIKYLFLNNFIEKVKFVQLLISDTEFVVCIQDLEVWKTSVNETFEQFILLNKVSLFVQLMIFVSLWKIS